MLRRTVFFSVLLGLLALPSLHGNATVVTNSATAWLVSQQQSDGGFEVAGYSGMETPDAVLAIAEDAQTGAVWSSAQALAAISALKFGGSGPTPLDALDDLAESTPTAGRAAKLIVNNVLPLGLDPGDFDPSADSPAPVDLVAALDAGCLANSGSFGLFGETLYGVMAKRLVCGAAPPAAIAAIRAAQQSNGGWNFGGTSSGTDIDIDMTSLAINALIAAGVGRDDADVREALGLLATSINAGGSWDSPFAASDPNSTAMGLMALRAAGLDPVDRCWRDIYAPERSGEGYSSPGAWLESQQQLDGHIASPYDSWGVNTLATSQSVQALLASWLPVVRDSNLVCPETVSFLAEGSTGPGFETWVLVANPSETETVTARVTFLTGSSPAGVTAVKLPPLTRESIRANDYVTDWSVSTQVEGLDGKVIAERSMYSSASQHSGAHLGRSLESPANQWFLAEGSTGPGFETWVLVANPEPVTATVTVDFLTGSGPGPSVAFELPPQSRRSIRANDYVLDWEVSARVTSTGAQVVAERSTYLSAGGRNGATDSPGVTATSGAWFLAEGSTGPGFETWVLVANPEPVTATVTVDFLTGSGPGPSVAFELPPQSRRSIRANDYVLDWSVSARVTSTGGGVVAERSVYTTTEARVGVTSASGEGVADPANQWFLAEGSTGPGFETWVLVANPEPVTATVTVDFLTGSGPGPSVVFELPPKSRRSIRANDHVLDWEVASRVRASGAAVVAEHAIYAPGELSGDALAGAGWPL